MNDFCLVDFNKDLIYSSTRREAIVISAYSTLIKYDLSNPRKPVIIDQKVFKEYQRIRPFDDNRFFLFHELKSELFILNWDDWDSFQCFELPKDAYYDEGIADAVHVKGSDIVVCGGSWNKIFLLNLTNGTVTDAYDKLYPAYVHSFSLADNSQYITHANQDQFSEFVISEIEPERKTMRVIGKFMGDSRCHEDAICFSSERPNEFAHVYQAGSLPFVKIRKVVNNKLVKLYTGELDKVDHSHDGHSSWKSSILNYKGGYIIGNGRKVYRLHLIDNHFHLQKIVSMDSIINAMALDKQQLILGTNQGICFFDLEDSGEGGE